MAMNDVAAFAGLVRLPQASIAGEMQGMIF
jgi:hypothetical protein